LFISEDFTGMTDKTVANNIAKLFQAIGEANRIRIVECLWNGSKNVTELANLLNMKIVNVSHHLSVLKNAGLVHDEKQGRFVVYSLHPDYFRKDPTSTGLLDLGWCILTPKR
jgi:ArsR family transcriptional regulator, nickel/cobalt-responsive transcriptional repressor